MHSEAGVINSPDWLLTDQKERENRDGRKPRPPFEAAAAAAAVWGPRRSGDGPTSWPNLLPPLVVPTGSAAAVLQRERVGRHCKWWLGHEG